MSIDSSERQTTQSARAVFGEETATNQEYFLLIKRRLAR